MKESLSREMELTWAVVIIQCALATFAYWFYFVYKSPFAFWTTRSVAQLKTTPIIGDTLRKFSKSVLESTQRGYKEFPNEKMVGKYANWVPVLLLRDPDLIHTVLVKDFSHFCNRASQSDPNGFFTKHLLNLSDEHWRSYRTKLNPTFSLGKMKGMHNQLIECGQVLLEYMKQFEDGSPFEARNIVRRYSMDVIASCAFGLNIDTINNTNSEFRRMGLEIFAPSFVLKCITTLQLKPLLRKLGIDRVFYSKEIEQKMFFRDVIERTLDERRKKNIAREDFLHLMNELLQKDRDLIAKNEISPNDPHVFDHSALISNAFVFLAAGFDTTATTISCAMYELAVNQDVQVKAYEEISKIMSKYDGLPDYGAIKEMTYLDWIVSETLRKYPPVPILTRAVTKDYTIPGTEVHLPVGTQINIPVYSIHHDPQYYPEPERFRPERFDKDQHETRNGIHLSLGIGPRMCIGSRFARTEVKVVLAMIIKKYLLIPCTITMVPLKFHRDGLQLSVDGGIWLKLQCRQAILTKS